MFAEARVASPATSTMFPWRWNGNVPLRHLCISIQVLNPPTTQFTAPVSHTRRAEHAIGMALRDAATRYPGARVKMVPCIVDEDGRVCKPPSTFAIGGGGFAKDYVHELLTPRHFALRNELQAFAQGAQVAQGVPMPNYLFDSLLDILLRLSSAWDRLVQRGWYYASTDMFPHTGRLLWHALLLVGNEGVAYKPLCADLQTAEEKVQFAAAWLVTAHEAGLPWHRRFVMTTLSAPQRWHGGGGMNTDGNSASRHAIIGHGSSGHSTAGHNASGHVIIPTTSSGYGGGESAERSAGGHGVYHDWLNPLPAVPLLPLLPLHRRQDSVSFFWDDGYMQPAHPVLRQLGGHRQEHTTAQQPAPNTAHQQEHTTAQQPAPDTARQQEHTTAQQPAQQPAPDTARQQEHTTAQQPQPVKRSAEAAGFPVVYEAGTGDGDKRSSIVTIADDDVETIL